MYIGIDLGTSSVKVLLVDEKGAVINEICKTYPVISSSDKYSEQDPHVWWKKTKEAIKELLISFDSNKVKAISFSGQMHGLVLLDSKNNIIRNAILWNDGRSEKEVKYLNEIIGKETLVNETGNFAFAGFTLPKLLWVKKNEPENYKKISILMLPKDYLAFCLTGKYSTDYSDAAGTLLLDVKNKKWSKYMCDIAGITFNQLPELYESYDVVSKIIPDVAKELGLSKDVKIVAGAGDNAAAAIGTGCIKDGSCNISLGTSGTIFVATDNFLCDKNVALHSFNHATGKYHLMGCILSAASANSWWVKQILCSEFSNELYDILKYQLTSTVIFLPYLSGERCPYNDVNAKGAFINITSKTTKREMSLSVLEGVSFALYDCFNEIKNKGINIDKLTICGGGSKNKAWSQIISDIFNMELEYVKTEQGPSYGAAILAMVGDGLFNSISFACDKLIEYKDKIIPNKKAHDFYETKYAKYRKLYNLLKDVN